MSSLLTHSDTYVCSQNCATWLPHLQSRVEIMYSWLNCQATQRQECWWHPHKLWQSTAKDLWRDCAVHTQSGCTSEWIIRSSLIFQHGPRNHSIYSPSIHLLTSRMSELTWAPEGSCSHAKLQLLHELLCVRTGSIQGCRMSENKEKFVHKPKWMIVLE